MENLDRGVVAIPMDSTHVFVSWRLLGTEPSNLGFNLYRSVDNGTAGKLNDAVLTQGTCFTDSSAQLARETRYFVRAVKDGIEQDASAAFTLPANSSVRPYLSVSLSIPSAETMPDGSTCTYAPNDCSVGDLDGDGEYEIVVKWDPSNAKDNSQSGYTGRVFLDAYKLNGTRLWRIDLGKNIRAGAHYTQFMVYDLDGDGCAEIACKTADGSIDGTGRVLGDSSKDYRTTEGYVLSGAEYLSVFCGATGAELSRVNYTPPRGSVSSWGDNYGNRVDRFLACVAYLDGKHPSLVMCRGYYTRAVLAAYDFNGSTLSQRWVFDSADGTPGNSSYEGQGNHNLSVGDVDGDGFDEIIYGSCAIDHNGLGLYNTKLGHGDAMHMGDLNPDRPGLEVWSCHEPVTTNGGVGLSFRDAKTGEVLWTVSNTSDTGRCVTMDIDPRYKGSECWGPVGGLYSAKGELISSARPGSYNFAVWWDGDLLREVLDGNHIDKWNFQTSSTTRLLTATGSSSCNGTKATPNLSADILGDWREEVIWRADDSSELRIYSTTISTDIRIPTLMHDPQYRLAVAWQNTAYNQPPHPGYYLGDGMATPTTPNITTKIDTSGTQLSALSVRTFAGSGDNVLIVGLVVEGNQNLPVIIRGVGPALNGAVSGFMTDPSLTLFSSTGRELSKNSNWSTGTDGTAITAFCDSIGLGNLSGGSKDAALLATLSPGVYTAHIAAETGADGIALAEIYAKGSGPDKRLYGLSARARASSGDDRLIAGFILSGTTPKRLRIRALGPEISSVAGYHPDPVLELYRFSDSTLLRSNDDWSSSGNLATDSANLQLIALPSGSKDAAMLVTLHPGIYTAHAYGKNGTSGIVLIDIYEVE